GRLLRAADFHGPGQGVDRHDRSERSAIGILAERSLDVVAALERRFLRRGGGADRRGPVSFRRWGVLGALRPADGLALLHELLAAQIAQAEDLPPRALLLATEVREQTREEPSAGLLCIALVGLRRNADEERVGVPLEASISLAHRFARLRRCRSW